MKGFDQMALVPYVLEQTSRGERSYDIYLSNSELFDNVFAPYLK